MEAEWKRRKEWLKKVAVVVVVGFSLAAPGKQNVCVRLAASTDWRRERASKREREQARERASKRERERNRREGRFAIATALVIFGRTSLSLSLADRQLTACWSACVQQDGECFVGKGERN